MLNHSLSWHFFTELPCNGSIVDSSTLNGCFQVRRPASSGTASNEFLPNDNDLRHVRQHSTETAEPDGYK